MKIISNVGLMLMLAAMAAVGLTACDDENASGISNQFVIGNDG